MHCTHCQGVMGEEQFFDCEGTQGFMWMRGWRCVDCGHAVDPLIDANRRLNALTQLALPHIWRPTGSDGVPRRTERVGNARFNQAVISEPHSQAKDAEERHRYFVKMGDRALNLDNLAQIEPRSGNDDTPINVHFVGQGHNSPCVLSEEDAKELYSYGE